MTISARSQHDGPSEIRRLKRRVARLRRELAALRSPAGESVAPALPNVPGVDLSAIVKQAPVILWVLDAEGRFVLSEGNLLAQLGWAPGEAVGKHLEELFAGAPDVLEASRRALEGEAVHMTVTLNHLEFDLRYEPLRNQAGALMGTAGIAVEVSRHAAVERELRSSPEQSQHQADRTDQAAEVHEFRRQARIYELILNQLGDGIAVVGPDGSFLELNPQGRRILGTGASAADATHWPNEYGLYLPDQKTPFPAEQLPLTRAIRGERVEQQEIYLKHPRLPEERWLSVTATPLVGETGEPAGAVAVFRDITATKRAEEALRAERQALECMVNAFDRDRQLIAYDIHDGLVQQITGAMLQLEGLRHRLRDSEPTAGQVLATVEETAGILRFAIEDARRLIGGLQPPVIDLGGIPAAIEYLVQQYGDRGELDVTFDHNLGNRRFPALIESTVFRTVQESLTNVVRHSGSHEASVSIQLNQGPDGNEITVEVRDAGHGFEPQAARADRFGLRGIRERARLLGGKAQIHSAPGEGVCVEVTIPIPQELPARLAVAAGSAT